MKYCPYCEAELERLDYSAEFNERNYGRSNGSCGLDGEDCELFDSHVSDTEDFEEYDFEYFCPECDHGLELEELLDELKTELTEELKKESNYKKSLFVFKGIEKNI